MIKLPHTHNDEPLSKAVCSACIVHAHFVKLGQDTAKKNKAKGSDYFRQIRAMGIEKQKAKKLLLDK